MELAIEIFGKLTCYLQIVEKNWLPIDFVPCDHFIKLGAWRMIGRIKLIEVFFIFAIVWNLFNEILRFSWQFGLLPFWTHIYLLYLRGIQFVYSLQRCAKFPHSWHQLLYREPFLSKRNRGVVHLLLKLFDLIFEGLRVLVVEELELE